MAAGLHVARKVDSRHARTCAATVHCCHPSHKPRPQPPTGNIFQHSSLPDSQVVLFRHLSTAGSRLCPADTVPIPHTVLPAPPRHHAHSPCVRRTLFIQGNPSATHSSQPLLAGSLIRVALTAQRRVVPAKFRPGLAWCSTDASVASNGDAAGPDPEDLVPGDDEDVFIAGGSGAAALRSDAPYRKSEDRARRGRRGARPVGANAADNAFQRWRREEARFAYVPRAPHVQGCRAALVSHPRPSLSQERGGTLLRL